MRRLGFGSAARARQGGQSLILAAFTMFLLVVSGLMIFGVSENTSIQIRLQNAADSASYAGAQVEADCVAQIAWLNEGMSHIYYHTMRCCTDCATYGVLAELADFQPDSDSWDPEGVVGLPAADAPAAVVGVDDAATGFNEAYARAAEWVPRGEAWLKRLSTLEHGIAAVAPTLVENQVFFTAAQNGAERTCYFPGFTLLPDGPTKHDVTIKKVGDFDPDPWSPNGWECSSTTDTFEMSAMHMHEAQSRTDVQGDSDSSKVAGFFSWSSNPGWHEIWDISLTEGGSTITMEVKARYESETWGDTRPAVYFFSVNTPAGLEERVVKVDVSGNCTVIPISGGGGQVGISFTDGTDGTSSMDLSYADGTTLSLKYDSSGYLCKWVDGDGDGQKDADEWVRVSDSTSATVNGVEVPFDFNPHIEIADGVSVDVTDPINLYIKKLHVVLSKPPSIDYRTAVGWLNFKDEAATINSLSTATADGVWRRVPHDRQEQDHDRIRHRMSVVTEDEEWLYEWVRVGSYMSEMTGANPDAGSDDDTLALIDKNMFLRFAVHSIMDEDEHYINSGVAERWQIPVREDDEDWTDNGQSGSSQWMYFPQWAKPPRYEADPLSGDADFGGWFDLATGAPQYKSPLPIAPKYGYSFSQTRKCWYCCREDVGSVSGPLVDMALAETDPYFGKKFVRPCGFWHDTDFINTPGGMADRLAKYPDSAVAIGFEPDDKGNPYGRYAIQVYCPVCNQQRDFTDKSKHGPPYQYYADGSDLSQCPTLVRRYLYHSFGRGYMYDDRETDPVKRTMDQEYNVATAPLKRDFYSIKMDFSSESITFRPPLQLTSELFRNAVTVVTYAQSVESDVWSGVGGTDPTAQEKNLGIYNPLTNPDWGHFSLSVSRLFMATGTNSSGGATLNTNFTWDGEAIEGEESTDIIGRQKNWNRQRWLRGSQNLFEPGWTAALAPVRVAIDPKDYYTEEELSATDDNGTALLLRLLKEARWRKNAADSGQGWSNADSSAVKGWNLMKAPPMQDVNDAVIDWDDPEIENAVRH